MNMDCVSNIKKCGVIFEMLQLVQTREDKPENNHGKTEHQTGGVARILKVMQEFQVHTSL